MKQKRQSILIGLVALGVVNSHAADRFWTNLFDGSGSFVFTNAISPGEPRRFYRLQVP